MRYAYFVTLLIVFLVPCHAAAGGLLEEATMSLEKIANDKSLSKESAVLVNQASSKIERAALAQSLQEDALTKRITELETIVKKQQEIILKYEVIVAELQAKLPKDTK